MHARQLVENEMPVYNPLLIYGGSRAWENPSDSGYRKCHRWKISIQEGFFIQLRKNFQTLFSRCFRRGEIQEFRDTFRSLDVLLLDDIQFFEKVFGKGGGTIEEEFFHTFNKLQELGKQIIMISDRYPKDIKNLSKRMESRFLSGLSVEIQQPGIWNEGGYSEKICSWKKYWNWW